MAQSDLPNDIVLADTATKLGDAARGGVIVTGSHGGRYAAYLTLLAHPRAVIHSDAGVGKDEAGIAPHEIEWHAPAAEAEEMKLPANVTVKQSPASILGLERLLDGTADALMTARTPMVPAAHRHRVKRVIPDAAARQRAWYQRTGYFPILHVIAIRDDALKARPDFGIDICRAYDAAKEHCYRVLQDERMTGLPLMRGYLDDTLTLAGDDPWPYGLERNRAEIERFLDLALEHGLTARRVGIAELFDPRAAAYAFTARMTPGCITGTADGGWAPASTLPG